MSPLAPSAAAERAPGGPGVLVALAVAYFLFLLLPSLSPHYGFYSDELYYLACADRLAFGYVDQPPFFVFVLRLWREIFGDSLFALRMLPAAAGAGTAFLAGWMARRMGGRLFAQGLAALAVIMSPAFMASMSFFSVNCLGLLLWTAASCLLLELCRSREPRLWIGLGVVLGLALLNKHTAVVPIAGVAVATLLTPLRRHLLGPWPWLGALLALLIVAPNLYWQALYDWPSLEFYRESAASQFRASPLEQLFGQIVFHNPAAFPIVAGGVYFLLGSPRGLRFRPLGWFFLTGLVLAMIGGSRLPYRLAGVFPVVFAAGAVLLEAVRVPDPGPLRRVWNTYTMPALMLVVGLAASTIILPLLPPPVLERNPLYNPDEGSGWRREVGVNRIPYHLGNRTHWEAFAARVSQVYEDLDPDERARTVFLADYFGHAGALEYYGLEGLAPVYSSMTGYFLWGPPPESAQTVIAIGIDPAFLTANFEQVSVAAVFRCSYCPPRVDELPIRIARTPKRPWSELWPEIGRLEPRRPRMLREQQSEGSAGDSQ